MKNIIFGYGKQHIQTLLSLVVIVSVSVLGYRELDVSNAQTIAVLTSQASVIQQASSSIPTVNASSVDSFIGSEGVNIHSSYLSSPYKSGSNILGALQKLGIHNVRDNPSVTAGSQELSNLQFLETNGIKFDFIINTTAAVSGNTGSIQSLVDEINKNSLAGGVLSLEGANELDNVNSPNYSANWANNANSIQEVLNSDAQNGHFVVLGPSLVGIDDTADSPTLAATGIGALLNIGNIHAYPKGGYTPESTIQSHLTAEAKVSGSKPIWATESGYNDCPAGTCSSAPTPVNQSDQAILDPRIFLAYYQHNVPQTFYYELFNEATGTSNYQDYWGLFNNDLSAKPSGQAISNMNSILSSNDKGAPSSSGLSYQATGDGNLQQLLLGKHTSSGDHYDLLVWENTLPSGSTQSAAISFGQSVNVAKYTPTSSANSVASYSAVTSIPEATVGPAITIYEISAVPNPPPTPTSSPSSTVTQTGSSTSSGSGSKTGSSINAGVKDAPLPSLGQLSNPIKADTITLAPGDGTPTQDITKVEYYANGKLIATVSKPPFTYRLTKDVLGDGCHTVKTIVYTSKGVSSNTSRQVCAAFTNSASIEKQWAIAIVCVAVILLTFAEFAPFYPKGLHLISKSIKKLWKKFLKLTGKRNAIDDTTESVQRK